MNKLVNLMAELERDRSVYLPGEWRKRIDVLDRLEWYLMHEGADADESIHDRASKIGADLEAANAEFYESLRADIRKRHGAKRLMQCSISPVEGEREGDHYDALDMLVSGVLRLQEPAEPVVERAPEMVFYQPTPATRIFDFIRRAELSEQDVLIDLGAGLGHVPLLAAICSSAQCMGIEYEPAYVMSAAQCATALNLDNATFLQQDVREADLSQGTVFYLYTPFMGSVLHDVLDKLRHEATQRDIRIGTLGPCTGIVAKESWLQSADTLVPHKIAMFRSI